MKNIVLYCCGILLLTSISSCEKDKPENTDPHNNPFGTDYTQTTPWPKWIFSPWVWEDEGTATSAKAIVDDYLAHDIPVGAIIIDSPWETGYNTFEADETLYPNLKGVVDYMHGKNVRVMMWITCMINTDVQPLYDTAAARGYFMKESVNATSPKVISWWKGDGSLIDFYNPEAVAWWKQQMDKALAAGIDGWKCDGTDYSQLYAPYSPGAGSNVTRLNYSHKYYQIFNDYTREKLGTDRVVSGRPIDNYGNTFLQGDVVAFMPKEIGWACWVGDQDATFNGLKMALNNMYHSANYGYLSFGSDIGGYREDNDNAPYGRSKELLIRWAQLGAFCPIMENGGGGEHRPWMFDNGNTEAVDIYRTYAKLHSKMVPYLMKTAETKFAAGQSMVHYFNSTDYSYLLGEDIFVAPILGFGGTVTINFPSGSNWVYLFDKSQVFTGGTSQTITYTLDKYPVFVKQGSDLETTLTP